MSKTLVMVRHAKSDWSDVGQKDFDRDLNARGYRDAPKVGVRLRSLNVKPDKVFSSPALRAKLTSQFVIEQLEYQLDEIVYDEELYEASSRSLLNFINSIDDHYNNVIIFGHNPTFTYVAEYLTGSVLGNVPTSGAVSIRLEIDSWKEASKDLGKLQFFIYPKDESD